MMSPSEAMETYINGNITDFKTWLKETNKSNIVAITYLWLNAGYPMLKLKSYCLDF